MACGAPVIGSNASCIPEVIGRKDALFDPLKPIAITEAIMHALTNEGYRQSLRDHAVVQAAQFSWEQSARRALERLKHFTATTASLGDLLCNCAGNDHGLPLSRLFRRLRANS